MNKVSEIVERYKKKELSPSQAAVLLEEVDKGELDRFFGNPLNLEEFIALNQQLIIRGKKNG